MRATVISGSTRKFPNSTSELKAMAGFAEYLVEPVLASFVKRSSSDVFSPGFQREVWPKRYR